MATSGAVGDRKRSQAILLAFNLSRVLLLFDLFSFSLPKLCGWIGIFLYAVFETVCRVGDIAKDTSKASFAYPNKSSDKGTSARVFLGFILVYVIPIVVNSWFQWANFPTIISSATLISLTESGQWTLSLGATSFSMRTTLTLTQLILFILLCIGAFLRGYAAYVLGASFTRTLTTVPGQRVFQENVYAFVRHPGYAGTTTVWLLSAALRAEGHWLAILLVFGVTVWAFEKRMTVEEQMMLENFGDEYKKYMKKTYRLFPGIY